MNIYRDRYPAARSLVPEFTASTPEGWTLIEHQILSGLPFTFEISKTLRAKLIMHTGLARQWIDVDPRTIVATSQSELDSHRDQNGWEDVGSSGGLIATRPGLAIEIRSARAEIGNFPLRVGVSVPVPQDGSSPLLAEFMILAWQVSVGNVIGPGDFGSFVRLAWRAAGQTDPEFRQPTISEYVQRRSPPAQRIESQTGLRERILRERIKKSPRWHRPDDI